jgi:integrase
MKKSKTYPVKLRVYAQNKTEMYPTTIGLNEKDFEKLEAKNIGEGLRQVRDQLKELKEQAEESIKENRPFTFIDFERKFVQHHPLLIKKQSMKYSAELPELLRSEEMPADAVKRYKILSQQFDEATIGNVFQCVIKKLILEGRIGSAENYYTSYRAFEKFKGNVLLEQVTVSYLMQFENYQNIRGISRTTIGIYTRSMRAVFNEAIFQDIATLRQYPFGRRKYRVPTGKGIKKALTHEELLKIYNYQCDPNNPTEQRAKDMWLFSYFGNGINFKDTLYLKFKDIHEGFIIFERAKTERANRDNPVLISVFITEDMYHIMDRWGNKNKAHNNLIFPVLDLNSSLYQQHEDRKLFIHMINEWMRKMQKELGITKKITTYVARHTFSTVMKNSGASPRFIQEALGHQSLTTTENYLASFDDATKKRLAANLEGFKTSQAEDLSIS